MFGNVSIAEDRGYPLTGIRMTADGQWLRAKKRSVRYVSIRIFRNWTKIDRRELAKCQNSVRECQVDGATGNGVFLPFTDWSLSFDRAGK
jgi:hypothetical protein